MTTSEQNVLVFLAGILGSPLLNKLVEIALQGRVERGKEKTEAIAKFYDDLQARLASVELSAIAANERFERDEEKLNVQIEALERRLRNRERGDGVFKLKVARLIDLFARGDEEWKTLADWIMRECEMLPENDPIS